MSSVQEMERFKRGILFAEHEILLVSRLMAAHPGPPGWKKQAIFVTSQQILESLLLSGAMMRCERHGLLPVSVGLQNWAISPSIACT